MRSADPRLWDAAWHGQSPTLTARTMTQLLDRVKLAYLRSILPPSGRTLDVEATQGFWRRFDGTRVAEWLGFYYFAWASKG